MYFVEMKGDKKLSLAEIKALCNSFGSRIIKRCDGAVVIDTPIPFSRLTASRAACEMLSQRQLKARDFGEFRVVGPRRYEIEIGAMVKGHANMRAPESVIRVVPAGKAPLVGLQVWEFSQADYARLLPPCHLVLKRPLSVLLLNLSGAKPGDVLLDPFCGSGSIPIEAELRSVRAVGSDISREMTERFAENCAKLGISPQVINADVKDLYFDRKFDAVATDLPYGHSSPLYGRKKRELYGVALAKISEFLKPGKYAAVMADERIRTKYLKTAGILVLRVHKNMVRYIHVFQKKS